MTFKQVDFSKEWIRLFEKYGSRSIEELVDKGKGVQRPFLMEEEAKDGGSSSLLPREVAFRLCALRETFEESGIFLSSSSSSSPPDPGLLSRYRNLVHEDPRQLLRLCEEAEVVPDVWALSEVADWLTPLGGPASKEGGRRSSVE